MRGFMNFSIHIDNQTSETLKRTSVKLKMTRNAIINLAVKAWLLQYAHKAWPKSVREFKGIGEFKSFESYRDELLPPKEMSW